ncbi:putative effector protein [Ceratobasidium theobromae]|uniref:Putative effector protein n=1 Tax=Ceratobasidium theobromae TaxID=1582974 RepID=A0A5N5QIN1_9AGAM|nr:putative effector protein [Ceratobasidium theobromae]
MYPLSQLSFVAAFVLTQLSSIVSGAPTTSCGQTHTVVAGESCFSIATAANLTLTQFRAMNPTVNCDPLAIGQVVCSEVACSKFYTVQFGDSCWKIGQDYSTTPETIEGLNPGLYCTAIFPNQKMCVAA